MPRFARRRGTLLVALSVLLSGCYKQVPISLTAAPIGTRARVVLSDVGTVEMASEMGPGLGIIEGDVISGDADRLTLAVRRVERRDGLEEFWKGEPVTIPRGFVASFSERRVSRSRTSLLGAGLAAGAIALGGAFAGGGGWFGHGGRGPGSEK